MFDKVKDFLGKARWQLLLGWVVASGVLSLALRVVEADWAVPAQTLLALVSFVGIVAIFVSALDAELRTRWLAILAPALGLLVLGALFLPQQLPLFFGGAFGWAVAGALIFGRSEAPIEYRKAIKALRRADYDEAVKIMDGLIKTEPNEANHYRFRAELLRLGGKLGRARNDYDKMRQVAKDDATRAVAYNGLAELELQARQYAKALEHARQAYALAPNDWVTAYNMGMIQDRLGDSAGVVESLSVKLNGRVADARHRLLISLYLARAWARQGDHVQAQQALERMKASRQGLAEWEKLLADKGATTLRDVLADDVATVKRLVDGTLELEQLGGV